MALPPDDAFRRGVGLLQAGQVAEAERAFKDILRKQPRHPGALNLLAIVTMRTGRLPQAEDFAKRALRETPQSDATLYNYGLILRALGKPAEALQRFTEALTINPAVADTWNNRGVTFNDLRRHDEAVADFDRALAIKGNYPEALCNKGKALAGLLRFDQALAAYDAALAQNPALTEGWVGRGNTLYELRRYADALAAYERASALRSDAPDVWLGRGNVYIRLHRDDEAMAAFDKALALQPALAEAWHGRGNVNADRKRYDEALADYDKALTLKPDLAEGWLGRGNLLFARDHNEEAQTAYDKALAINPALASAWIGCGNIHYAVFRYPEAETAYDRALALRPDLPEGWVGRGNIMDRLQRHAEAADAYDRALKLDPGLDYVEGDRLYEKQFVCDWTAHAEEAAHLLAAVRAGEAATAPFPLLSIASTAADQLRCAEAFTTDKFPTQPPLWNGERYAHDRIRIAYLSADFRDHATSYLVADLFECHDRARFETTAISWGPDDGSQMRRRIVDSVERFVDVRTEGQEKTAHLLRELEIDIAVDLMGYVNGSRAGIPARRTAPVQVNYLGYPGTLGSPVFDYIVADETIIPAAHRDFYSEKVVWLPDTYQPNDRRRVIAAATPTRGECGLPEEGFVFCSFNNLYKIKPDIFDIWMRLLRAIEGSVLWLIAGSPETTANLRREAEQRGVAGERLVFASRAKLADHLARHRLADLFIDTLPYNAHTTASDALWVGLPLVTCLGGTFASRVAGSLVRAAGLGELVTENLADYEALALKLARDPALLGSFKAKLARERDTCALFDTPRFTRHMETAFVTMWERYQRGEAPEHIAVAPLAD